MIIVKNEAHNTTGNQKEKNMKTSPKRRRMITDAKLNGCTVQEWQHSIEINVGKTRRSVGITLWPDGTATRNDVDLTLCTAIRTVKAMRQLLDLGVDQHNRLPVIPVCGAIMDIINS